MSSNKPGIFGVAKFICEGGTWQRPDLESVITDYENRRRRIAAAWRDAPSLQLRKFHEQVARMIEPETQRTESLDSLFERIAVLHW